MIQRCILVVDDEPSVLEALRRRFRSLRKDWTVLTALGGEAAVELLGLHAVTAVVTDMRMPGTDGLAVLERAAALQPAALRIVLSGQIDLEKMEATLPLAQHCLSKPCDVAAIVGLIERQAP